MPAARKESFNFDEDGSSADEIISNSSSPRRRGRSASLGVPMLRVTRSDLGNDQEHKPLRTTESRNLLNVESPVKVPDTYFERTNVVIARAESFPVRGHKIEDVRKGLEKHRRDMKVGETYSISEAADLEHEDPAGTTDLAQPSSASHHETTGSVSRPENKVSSHRTDNSDSAVGDAEIQPNRTYDLHAQDDSGPGETHDAGITQESGIDPADSTASGHTRDKQREPGEAGSEDQLRRTGETPAFSLRVNQSRKRSRLWYSSPVTESGEVWQRLAFVLHGPQLRGCPSDAV